MSDYLECISLGIGEDDHVVKVFYLINLYLMAKSGRILILPEILVDVCQFSVFVCS